MKVVYIAGPYRADSPWGIEKNIRMAEEALAVLWERGVPAISPHTNCRFLTGIASDEVFINGTLEIMLRCDAVVVVGTRDQYLKSFGTVGEIEAAEENNIPVFYWEDAGSMVKMTRWLSGAQNAC